MTRLSLILFTGLFVTIAAQASTAQQDAAPSPVEVPEVPEVPAASGDLRVMVWNVQRGSNHFDYGPEKVLAWIRAAEPDIVLMQESYDIDGDRPTLGRWLAAELGWDHHQGDSTHLCIISPLTFEQTYFHETWHGIGARLRDAEGRRLVAYSIWIDYRAYTPYALRDTPEIDDESLIANETDRSGRMAQTDALLEHLRDTGHLGSDTESPGGTIPLLVGGDWNCPSHLDWTEETELVFRFRRALPLPVSTAMQNTGFVDTFREVHPSPLAAPGITWSPLSRGSREAPGTADRIDRLYHLPAAEDPSTPSDEQKPARLRAVAALTLPRSYEDASIEQANRLFPSDHAAVLIDLVWE